jgi:hypothetical protein
MLQEAKKPTRTSAELEAVIKQELQDVGRSSPDIAITVQPDGLGWKVVIPQDVPVGTDDFEVILLIADRLRSQFDLKR